MKKLLLTGCIALLGYTINAQTSFGVTGGYYSYIEKVSNDDISLSEDVSGFFAGLFAEFTLNDKLKLQPELQVTSVFSNGESLQQLLLPILLKYGIDDKFSVLFGPQFDFVLRELPLGKEFGMALSAGLMYDFSENYYATFRYSLGVTERLDANIDDLKGSISGAHLGFGYRF